MSGTNPVDNRRIVLLHSEQDKAMLMVPKSIYPILATTYEIFLDKIKEYRPEACLFIPELLDGRQPWAVLEELKSLGCTKILVRTSSKEDSALFIYLERHYPELVILESLLGENEILQFLEHHLENKPFPGPEVDPVVSKTRAFIGTGGTGITSFILQAAPWYAEKYPDKNLLIVDMNEDKRDLSVALSAQVAQLSLMSSYLSRGSTNFRPFAVQHKYFPNVSVISAVQAWGSQEISTFLKVVAREFDEVWFDIGRPYHVPRLMEEVEEIVYVVRPDSLSLGGTQRIINDTPNFKGRLLISQLDTRYASGEEIAEFLGFSPKVGIFGYTPFEHPFLPLKIENGMIETSKNMNKAFEKMLWDIPVGSARPNFWSRLKGRLSSKDEQ